MKLLRFIARVALWILYAAFVAACWRIGMLSAGVP